VERCSSKRSEPVQFIPAVSDRQRLIGLELV
jgi:hypothetical protein